MPPLFKKCILTAKRNFFSSWNCGLASPLQLWPLAAVVEASLSSAWERRASLCEGVRERLHSSAV
jgi:hypothetical protein